MRQRCQTEDPMQPLTRTAALLPLALLVPTLASAEAVPVPVLAWDACLPAAAGGSELHPGRTALSRRLSHVRSGRP